jgi:hypothetical protein
MQTCGAKGKRYGGQRHARKLTRNSAASDGFKRLSWCASPATPAAGAAGPGTVERRIGEFGRDRVLSVDTAGSDRIVIAGITDG